MYSTTSDNCRERFTRNGWNITTDDDAPRPPDGDPLASGQRKRYLLSLTTTERKNEIH